MRMRFSCCGRSRKFYYWRSVVSVIAVTWLSSVEDYFGVYRYSSCVCLSCTFSFEHRFDDEAFSTEPVKNCAHSTPLNHVQQVWHLSITHRLISEFMVHKNHRYTSWLEKHPTGQNVKFLDSYVRFLCLKFLIYAAEIVLQFWNFFKDNYFSFLQNYGWVNTLRQIFNRATE